MCMKSDVKQSESAAPVSKSKSGRVNDADVGDLQGVSA